MTEPTTLPTDALERRCFCPGDCGCRMPEWMMRPVFCGCRQHGEEATP